MFKLLATTSIVMLLSAQAGAAQFDVSMTGMLTSQTNSGNDRNLAVGSTFTLTASFQDAYLLPYAKGNAGDQIVGLYGLPNSSFSVTAQNLSWGASDSVYGPSNPIVNPFFSPLGMEFSPALVINGDKVVAVFGDLSPQDPTSAPQISFGSAGQFFITAPEYLQYRFHLRDTSMDYQTPGFVGEWDFANSSVVDPPSPEGFSLAAISAAPEPETWAMFLLGFGVVGYAMRRKSYCAG